ncbi:MAG: KH domain-containing protein [Acidimicrobiia bacterium]|nr:KH domain-containing protein [Acidimicrobiia bacterium]
MSQGDIVGRVVEYECKEIAEDAEAVTVEVIDDGDDRVVAEVHAAKPDMGRLIGRRGRVARAIRTVASVAAEEEGLNAQVEFLD